MEVEIRYYEVDLGEVAEALRRYFKERDVALVVLFGSVLRRREVRDVNVAVKFNREPSLSELLRMGAELEDVLGAPVDLVPVDHAQPYLRLKILREGRLILTKDMSTYAELLKEAIGDVQDMEMKLAALHGKTGAGDTRT